MIRKAIVIVPSDEDYKARIEAQEKEETKDVPDNAVMEMKGIAKDKLTFFVVAQINLELLRIFYNLASKFILFIFITLNNYKSISNRNETSKNHLEESSLRIICIGNR